MSKRKPADPRTMFVRPCTGLVVPYPGGTVQRLPEQGAFVEAGSTWWLRRIADGDVERTDPPQPTLTAATKRTADKPNK